MQLTREKQSPPTSAVPAERWRRYKRTGDRRARDQLIMGYAPLVKYIAGRMASRMPAHVELADLVSYGLSGLIDAVERFDPLHGAAFETYANVRIRGAIVDQLRSLDWVPRAIRDEARSIEAATTALTTRLQRLPTDPEVAAELSLEPEQLDAALQRVGDARMVALDEPWGRSAAGGSELTLLDTLADRSGADPADRADARHRRQRIGEGVKQLSPREQVVLGLRYQQDLTFTEIGEIVGVSESRICQIHTRAALRMRALMSGDSAPAAGEPHPGRLSPRSAFERDE
ncbi:MAG TPA: FliA/WhiG family RNA polymerase sigma factor [Baekduia sp.]|nr:FliA/WhiG family RNA polymerase sigma factor [Baekduia sp.]